MAQQQMSLFGPSLAQTQAALAQEDEAITAKLAQLTPEQGLVRIAMQGGRQAGRALGGLFGIEDPRLKEAAQQEAIFKELKDSGVDFTDSEQLYPALINAYQSRGMIDKAIVAAAKYEDVKSTSLKTQAELGLKGAQTEKALAEAAKAQREKLDTPFGKVDPDKFTPESLDKFRESGNYADLVAKPDKAKATPSVGTDREAVSLELYNKNFMDLTQPERVAVNKRVEESSKGKQVINVDARQAQGVNAAQVKRFDDISNNAIAAEKSISNIDAMSRVLGNAFTGVGSGVALKAGQIANALGVTVTGTTETEQLKQLIDGLTAGQARTLPGSLSEKELEFLKGAIGNTGMTKQTLNAMLKRMRTEALTDKKAYEDVFRYQTGGGDLNKYDFVSNRSKARKEAQRISELLDKATPEQRRELGY